MREFVIVGFFMIGFAVVAGSFYMDQQGVAVPQHQPDVFSEGDGPIQLSAHLVQDKIFTGGDGTVSLSLTMHADDVFVDDAAVKQHVDMVIVLDQSGSMRGQKIQYAREAIQGLISDLSEGDRFALVGYSDGVWKYSPLTEISKRTRQNFQSIVSHIQPGGNTNLGGGLQEGIQTLLQASERGNIQKVVLISDGLANRGIVEPNALGNMASIAVENEFAISTVGVGQDFNEHVMTAIADRGAGNYYYLANPQTFAAVFQKEFSNSRTVAAHGVEIRIPLPQEASVISASGYPISVKNNQAIINPGDVLAGQSRTIFLTLQLPVHKEQNYALSGVHLQYHSQGMVYTAALSQALEIACVNDPNEVIASIDQAVWEKKVLQEDFNTLREQVAENVKKGKKDEALQQIEEYYKQNQTLNDKVGSSRVSSHLNEGLDELRDVVEETFSGSEPEVAEQQKANAKELQFKSYQERRAKK